MSSTNPVGRAHAIQLVTKSDLPIQLGSTRKVMVVEQDKVFRIREVVIDQAEITAATNAAGRTRSPSWMPTHHYALGRPTGEILAEAASREELIEVMRTMPWPEDW
jgi:hypothetical protein